MILELCKIEGLFSNFKFIWGDSVFASFDLDCNNNF